MIRFWAGVSGTLDPWMMRFTPWLMHLPITPLRWFLLLLTLAAMAWAGAEIYRRAWQAALHRSTNMNTLVALGTGAAFLYSAAATIVPGFFEQRGLSADVYFESVILILAFLLLGNLLDERARHRTTDALRSFAALQPPTARVLRDGAEIDLPLHAVITGDVLLVKPGERIPVDGIVTNGTSGVDESLLTGESLPVAKQKSSAVIGGSMNLDGALELRATTVGSAGTLAQMIRLMEQAQSAKAPMQRLADRASAIFVPTVIVISILTFALWMIFDTPGRAVAVAIAVLVIACPCAMGLAVPAALTVAVGRAAQLGILIKSGEALERLANIDTVAFDKTGTLTMGKPQITGLYLQDSAFSREQILRYAASLEARSEHPLAKAVVLYARAQLLTDEQFSVPEKFLALPGRGVSGTMEGHSILLGTTALLAEHEAAPAPIAPTKYTPLHMAIDGAHVATFEAEDTLRPEAAAAVAQLLAMEIVVVMLTGDTLAAAHSIADQAGIEDVRSSLMPADKVASLRSLQEYGHTVAMVGDGGERCGGAGAGRRRDRHGHRDGHCARCRRHCAAGRRRSQRAELACAGDPAGAAHREHHAAEPRLGRWVQPAGAAGCGGPALSGVRRSAQPGGRQRGHGAEFYFGADEQPAAARVYANAAARTAEPRDRLIL